MHLKELLTFFNESLTVYLVFPAMIFVGLYLSIRLKFVQVSKLKLSFKWLVRKDGGQGSISHYEAVSAVLAGNFGTGNISGMAIAVATGGPGALVWMWVMAFFGAVIQYASCLLGIKYRRRNEEGEYVGGPMYYLSQAGGGKIIGKLFAFAAICAALMVGNFAQVNSISLPMAQLGISPLVCGVVLAILSGFVILGGIYRFAKFASAVVPVMALIYFLTALVILVLNKAEFFPSLRLMFQCAFSPHAVLGGGLGYTIFKALSSGFERGVFATDAGTGLAPILQASAQTKNPVVDAVVTLVAPFLVMLVCTTTGLILLMTGAWKVPGLKSTNMVTFAFEQGLGHPIGRYIVILALFLFAYTTILAWCCCAEKAWGYIFGTKRVKLLRWLYILLIPVGAIAHVDIVWLLADTTIAMMLCLNLVGIMRLSSDVIEDSREYFLSETA